MKVWALKIEATDLNFFACDHLLNPLLDSEFRQIGSSGYVSGHENIFTIYLGMNIFIACGFWMNCYQFGTLIWSSSEVETSGLAATSSGGIAVVKIFLTSLTGISFPPQKVSIANESIQKRKMMANLLAIN